LLASRFCGRMLVLYGINVGCKHVWRWLQMRREPRSVDALDVCSVSLTAVAATVNGDEVVRLDDIKHASLDLMRNETRAIRVVDDAADGKTFWNQISTCVRGDKRHAYAHFPITGIRTHIVKIAIARPAARYPR
jgi:hypothetical protein